MVFSHGNECGTHPFKGHTDAYRIVRSVGDRQNPHATVDAAAQRNLVCKRKKEGVGGWVVGGRRGDQETKVMTGAAKKVEKRI
jgi:hypothetical protein